MALQSHLTAESVIMRHPTTGEETLWLKVTIECPQCGTDVHLIQGHHLRGMYALLAETIAMYPQHTGSEAGLQVLKRETFNGTSNDPSTS